MTPHELARVLPKIERIPFSTCWYWTGARAGGYGMVKPEGKDTLRLVHRLMYEHYVAPIPEGLVIDHLCRERSCVNPAHLEPVTMRENVLRGESFSAMAARKTHCDHGHPLSGDNLKIAPSGKRLCRTCRREWSRKERARWS